VASDWVFFFGHLFDQILIKHLKNLKTGMAYSNCQHDFQSPFLNPKPGSAIKVSDPHLIEAILKVILNSYFFENLF
jgi:hypothetical protein